MTEREIALRYLAGGDLSRLTYLACAMLSGVAGMLLFKAVLA